MNKYFLYTEMLFILMVLYAETVKIDSADWWWLLLKSQFIATFLGAILSIQGGLYLYKIQTDDTNKKLQNESLEKQIQEKKADYKVLKTSLIRNIQVRNYAASTKSRLDAVSGNAADSTMLIPFSNFDTSEIRRILGRNTVDDSDLRKWLLDICFNWETMAAKIYIMQTRELSVDQRKVLMGSDFNSGDGDALLSEIKNSINNVLVEDKGIW